MSYLNVNAVNKKGSNTIQQAHLYGFSKCVELLLEHGADESSLQGLEYGSNREEFPLHVIKKLHNHSLLSLLLLLL